MKIRLNAFHKDSSASYSETVEVFDKNQLLKMEKDFDTRVPFSRYYYDHEFVEAQYPDDEDVFDMWMRDL